MPAAVRASLFDAVMQIRSLLGDDDAGGDLLETAPLSPADADLVEEFRGYLTDVAAEQYGGQRPTAARPAAPGPEES